MFDKKLVQSKVYCSFPLCTLVSIKLHNIVTRRIIGWTVGHPLVWIKTSLQTKTKKKIDNLMMNK